MKHVTIYGLTVLAVSLVTALVHFGPLEPEFLEKAGYALFFGSFFLLGLPHGFVDPVLLMTGEKTWRKRLRQLEWYLVALGAGVLTWHLLPAIAVPLFLLLTAWHWGTTEVLSRRKNSKFAHFRGVAQGGVLILGVLAWDHRGALEALREASSANFWSWPAAQIFRVSWFVTLSLVVADLILFEDRLLRGRALAQLGLTVVLVLVAPAVLAIAVFYLCWHAPQSYAGLRGTLTSLLLRTHFWAWLAIAFYASVIFELVYLDPTFGFGPHFALLACLTLPHALLSFHHLRSTLTTT